MSLRALTSVGKMNQGSEGLWIDSLHLDLLLLRLSHIAGEHSGKVVRYCAQDQSAVRKTKRSDAPGVYATSRVRASADCFVC